MTTVRFAFDESLDSQPRLTGRWTDVFRQDALIHLCMMGSISAATFQGYLKDRIGGPIPYAIADLLFIAGSAIWFGFLAIRHAPVRGPGSLPMLLLAIILVPALYMLHPGSSLVIALAGLRGWSEFPVACLIALTLIKGPGQVRAYIWLILALCAITAVYGILQYQAGPNVVFSIGSMAVERHGASVQYYIPGSGTTDFRAFSTFAYPAPFAGLMVFGILLAAGVALSSHRHRAIRILSALLIPLLFAGMTVSGTRAALVIVLGGLTLLGWYRGFSARQLVLLPVGLVALHLGTLLTAGRILERYRTVITNEGELWIYLIAPVTIAARALLTDPFGHGLGRTGVGVPFSIVGSMPRGFFVPSDGDIGRAAVELGIVGLLILAVILFIMLPYIARAVRMLLGTESEDIALGAGPLVLATGALLLIGSPLATAPHGIIWWFFFGALLKLAILREDAEDEEDEGQERAAESGSG